MAFKHARLIPVILTIQFLITFLITYLTAVKRKDVLPFFPYISDTGTWPPESCLFGISLNIGAVLMGFTMYVRYRQIKELDTKNGFSPVVKQYNRYSPYLAILVPLGICIVANFQETSVLSIHILGAGLAFGLGNVYQCVEIKIVLGMYPVFGNKILNMVKILCAGVNLVVFTICSICGGLALLQFEGDDISKWHKEDGGYKLHIISTITEWMVLIFTLTFILTYTYELKDVEISEPEIKI